MKRMSAADFVFKRLENAIQIPEKRGKNDRSCSLVHFSAKKPNC